MTINLKQSYNTLSDFELLVEIGYSLSQQFSNQYTLNRRMLLSTHVLAKQMELCFSILKILPGSILSMGKEDYIDFSSFASLSRNLIEASNIHWYLSIEKISKDEECLRFLIYDYHDTIELITILRQLNICNDDIDNLETQLTELGSSINQNAIFQSLDKNKKRLIIKGKQGALLTQYEIAQHRNIDLDKFKGIYKLLSNQTHTSASSLKMLSFSKSSEINNEFNVFLTLLVLDYCNLFLADTILKTGNLWKIQFGKASSKKIVQKYSRNLIKKSC